MNKTEAIKNKNQRETGWAVDYQAAVGDESMQAIIEKIAADFEKNKISIHIHTHKENENEPNI